MKFLDRVFQSSTIEHHTHSDKYKNILDFKINILRSVMKIAMVFAFLFGLLHDLNINDIGRFHSIVNYVFSFVSGLLLIALKKDSLAFNTIASLFLGACLLTFTSVLLNVVQDEFRIIWFYFTIYIAYISLGSFGGAVVTALALISILTCNLLTDLMISPVAFVTAVVGLLISSLLSRVYTVQMEHYETQLNNKNIQLEKSILKLDTELEKSKHASETKSLFLANMSHEIRTPMNGVIGMAQALQGTDINDIQRHYLDALNSSGKSLLLLIDDLLDISKIESATLKLNEDPFNTFSWITDIQNIAEPIFENHKCVFITEIDNTLPNFLIGDETRLLQIIINLVNNAAKFTPTGEVKLSISGELVTSSSYKMSIKVEDNGLGISADKLDHIFKEFHQLSFNRTTNKGVGLGLAICKHLTKLMDGDISVTSTEEIGSVFQLDITLPISPDSSSINTITEQGATQIKKALNILLVDDNTINRLAARTLLNQQGHHVIESENGKQAIDCLETNIFDLILMDIHMPVMDGIETTEMIRKHGGNYKDIPIIGLTASVMTSEKVRYLEAGMNAVAEKPILIDKLLKLIQQVLH